MSPSSKKRKPSKNHFEKLVEKVQASNPELIALKWSPVPVAFGLEDTLSTTATFDLADSAGFIDLTVRGKDAGAINKYTSEAKFFFTHDSDEPPDIANTGDALPEQAPPQDEDGLVVEYVFRPNAAWSEKPVRTIVFLIDPTIGQKGYVSYSVRTHSAMVMITMTAGSVDASLKGDGSSSRIVTTRNPKMLQQTSSACSLINLSLTGIDATNTYGLRGSWNVPA